MSKYLALILLIIVGSGFIACGDEPRSGNAVVQNPNDTPTQAYKRLFEAVKNKNTEAIKQEFSKNSIAAAEAQATRMNRPVEEVYRNGFTRTTFAETLPEIRDERIKDDMGAIEVWNAGDRIWEDLPFIREESGWKLAVGDVFAGKWTSPGKGRQAREREAANAVRGGNPEAERTPNVNPGANTSSNSGN